MRRRDDWQRLGAAFCRRVNRGRTKIIEIPAATGLSLARLKNRVGTVFEFLKAFVTALLGTLHRSEAGSAVAQKSLGAKLLRRGVIAISFFGRFKQNGLKFGATFLFRLSSTDIPLFGHGHRGGVSSPTKVSFDAFGW
jgi:hypothetical protein